MHYGTGTYEYVRVLLVITYSFYDISLHDVFVIVVVVVHVHGHVFVFIVILNAACVFDAVLRTRTRTRMRIHTLQFEATGTTGSSTSYSSSLLAPLLGREQNSNLFEKVRARVGPALLIVYHGIPIMGSYRVRTVNSYYVRTCFIIPSGNTYSRHDTYNVQGIFSSLVL